MPQDPKHFRSVTRAANRPRLPTVENSISQANLGPQSIEQAVNLDGGLHHPSNMSHRSNNSDSEQLAIGRNRSPSWLDPDLGRGRQRALSTLALRAQTADGAVVAGQVLAAVLALEVLHALKIIEHSKLRVMLSAAQQDMKTQVLIKLIRCSQSS